MTAQSVFIVAAVLAVFWKVFTMSAALDRLNTAVDGLIARATANPNPVTPPTDGATAEELDAVTARINAADQPPADTTPVPFA